VTSSGEDGWFGFYLKTTDAGWNVQPALRHPLTPSGNENNVGFLKDLIPDGEWHLYEWNIDDTSGAAPDGWTAAGSAGVFGGVTSFTDGNHFLEALHFRNSSLTVGVTNTIYVDYITKSASGSVSNLLDNPCTSTAGVLVKGPLSITTNVVIVTGVASNATTLTVYQDSGSGTFASIGTKTTGVAAGDNQVTVSGLVKSAAIFATQTIAGQEGCLTANPVFVGGGASPSIRLALSIRETSSTGPIGTPGDISNGNLHFLGASLLSGQQPADARVISPSTNWQTVTFQRGTDPIVKWNSTSGTPTGTLNDLTTDYGILEALAFAIDSTTDSGPFNIYVDNIQNGSTVVQDFEGALNGSTDFTFRQPSFSTTTSGSLLSTPNITQVSGLVADTGSKSLNTQWQFNGTNANKWLRLTTSGATGSVNAQLDLNQPISLRILILPVGASAPAVTLTNATLSASLVNGRTVLSWNGVHNLQQSSFVGGPYTNAVASSTNAFNPTPSPYTVTNAESIKFFRLNN